ncbi:tRNA pseudouridine synthase A [Actinomycetota bacterium]|nr:tRNA pseudouridine synthase A [Actinomycetota bacterium]
MSDLPDPTDAPEVATAPVQPAGADAPEPTELVRVRIDLAYDGTEFAGWARQPGLRTVQAVLEDALATVLRSASRGEPAPRTTVAGRTDAGVHARGQVTHVDVSAGAWAGLLGRTARTAEEALVRRLTGVLPADVTVRRVSVAGPEFDARFSALGRHYVYRVCDDPELRDPLRRHHVLWNRNPLDVPAMAQAAELLLGRHDFAAYCKPREGATTIRTLDELTWTRETVGPDAGLVVARVGADAFCHSMVRALVGASLAVGEHRRGIAWPMDVLESRVHHPGGMVSPAHGLTLERVDYPAADELAARAALTRAKRAPDDVIGRAARDGSAPAPAAIPGRG